MSPGTRPAPDVAGSTLADHLRVLRRRAWIIGCLTLIGGLLGLQMTSLLPATHEARLALIVTGDDPAGRTELLRSDEVLAVTDEDPDETRRRLETRGPTESGVVTVRLTGEDPEAVMRELTAIADAFTARLASISDAAQSAAQQEQRTQRLAEDRAVADERRRLEDRRDTVMEEIDARTQELDERRQRALDDESVVSTVAEDTQLRLLTAEHDLLLRRLLELRPEPSTDGPVVTDQASVTILQGPTVVDRTPSPMLALIGITALSLLIGILVAFVVDRLDPWLRTPEDVAEVVSELPVFHLPPGDPTQSTRGVLSLHALRRWSRFASDHGPLLLPLGDTADVARGVAGLFGPTTSDNGGRRMLRTAAVGEGPERVRLRHATGPTVAEPLGAGGGAWLVDDPAQHVVLVVPLGRVKRFELELTAAEVARLHPTAILTVDLRTELPAAGDATTMRIPVPQPS